MQHIISNTTSGNQPTVKKEVKEANVLSSYRGVPVITIPLKQSAYAVVDRKDGDSYIFVNTELPLNERRRVVREMYRKGRGLEGFAAR